MPDLSLARYLLGLVILAAILGPLVFGGHRLAHRFLRDADPSLRFLASAVLTLSGLVIVSELLGTVGALHAAPLVAASAAVGIGAAFAAGAPTPAPGKTPGRPRIGLIEALAGLAAAAVAVAWLVPTLIAMENGLPTGADTWWYHMPFAARFAEAGSITALHPVADEPLISFYPATGSLLHAIGIVAFGTDVVSPLVNAGWLAFTLGTALALGRTLGAAPHVLLGVCIVLAAPVLRGSQPGEALVDVAVLGLILAGVALMLAAKGNLPTLAISGLAFGLAAGIKLTALPALAGAALALPWLARDRTRNGGGSPRPVLSGVAWWGGGAALTGSYWYLRDLFHTGSPFPFVHLPLLGGDPPSFLSRPPFDVSVPDQIRAGNLAYLDSGLDAQLGEFWPVLLVLGGLGLVAGGFRPGASRVVSAIGVFSFIGYLLLPQAGVFFAGQLRHATVALALGLAALATVLVARDSRWATATAIGFAALVALELTVAVIGRFASSAAAFLGAAGVVATAGLLIAVVVKGPRLAPAAVALAIVVGALAVGVRWHDGGGFVSGPYGGSPSLRSLGPPHQDPMALALEALRDVHDSRVAVFGTPFQYPLYGRALSNYVQYMGKPGPNGTYNPIRSCTTWMRRLAEGRYRYLLVVPFGQGLDRLPRQGHWSNRDPSLSVIVSRRPGVRLYRIEGTPSPDSCDGR